MHGHMPQYMFGLGPDHTFCALSWQTTTSVGALAKAANAFRFGTGWSATPAVSYAATGIYTVTFPSGMITSKQPICADARPQWATLATDWFECAVVGETTLTTNTRQVVVQCHRNGTAQAPANTAGNRINLYVYIQNNDGG